ncbi:uncharacterized protein [Anabrus simplex]|uniref:uncharacterized protein n=1 Tax=Anabrus simplex TaxID=316456 RepID=UPI0035A2C769
MSWTSQEQLENEIPSPAETEEAPYEPVGEEVQRLSVVQSLPDLLQEDNVLCMQRVVPKVQQALPQASAEFHMAASHTFLTILEKKLVHPRTFTQTFLHSIVSSLESKDPVVANAWLETLLDVMDLLPTDVIRQEILPIAVAKGQLNQTVSSRLTASKLLGKVCMRFETYTLKKEALPLVQSLCQDVNADVRASMCSQLKYVAKGFGPEGCKVALLPSLVELANDEESKVRLAALNTIVDILSHLQADTMKSTIIPLVKKICSHALAVEDMVLGGTSLQLGKLCLGLDNYLTISEKKWFMSHFQQLAQLGVSNMKKDFIKEHSTVLHEIAADAKSDLFILCRQHCAYNFPAMAMFSTKQGDVFNEQLYTTFCDLTCDPYFLVRRTIACGIHEVTSVLGPACGMVKNELVKLLRDDSDEVLQGLIPNIAMTMELLAKTGNIGPDVVGSRVLNDSAALEIGRALVKCEAEVGRTHNWRLHSLLLHQLECLPNCLPSDFINSHFIPIMFTRIHTARPVPCRVAAARTLLVFLRYNQKQVQRSDIRSRIITELCRGRSCYSRMMFIKICHIAIELYSRRYFKDYFFTHLLELAEDKIPNIRLGLVALIPKLKAMLRLPTDRQLLLAMESCVRRLLLDEKDRDVVSLLNVVIHQLDKIEVKMETQATSGMTPEDLLDQQKVEEENKLCTSKYDPSRKKVDPKKTPPVTGSTVGTAMKSPVIPPSSSAIGGVPRRPSVGYTSTNSRDAVRRMSSVSRGLTATPLYRERRVPGSLPPSYLTRDSLARYAWIHIGYIIGTHPVMRFCEDATTQDVSKWCAQDQLFELIDPDIIGFVNANENEDDEQERGIAEEKEKTMTHSEGLLSMAGSCSKKTWWYLAAFGFSWPMSPSGGISEPQYCYADCSNCPQCKHCLNIVEPSATNISHHTLSKGHELHVEAFNMLQESFLMSKDIRLGNSQFDRLVPNYHLLSSQCNALACGNADTVPGDYLSPVTVKNTTLLPSILEHCFFETNPVMPAEFKMLSKEKMPHCQGSNLPASCGHSVRRIPCFNQGGGLPTHPLHNLSFQAKDHSVGDGFPEPNMHDSNSGCGDVHCRADATNHSQFGVSFGANFIVSSLEDEFYVDAGIRIPQELAASDLPPFPSRIPNLREILFRNRSASDSAIGHVNPQTQKISVTVSVDDMKESPDSLSNAPVTPESKLKYSSIPKKPINNGASERTANSPGKLSSQTSSVPKLLIQNSVLRRHSGMYSAGSSNLKGKGSLSEQKQKDATVIANRRHSYMDGEKVTKGTGLSGKCNEIPVLRKGSYTGGNRRHSYIERTSSNDTEKNNQSSSARKSLGSVSCNKRLSYIDREQSGIPSNMRNNTETFLRKGSSTTRNFSDSESKTLDAASKRRSLIFTRPHNVTKDNQRVSSLDRGCETETKDSDDRKNNLKVSETPLHPQSLALENKRRHSSLERDDLERLKNTGHGKSCSNKNHAQSKVLCSSMDQLISSKERASQKSEEELSSGGMNIINNEHRSSENVCVFKNDLSLKTDKDSPEFSVTDENLEMSLLRKGNRLSFSKIPRGVASCHSSPGSSRASSPTGVPFHGNATRVRQRTAPNSRASSPTSSSGRKGPQRLSLGSLNSYMSNLKLADTASRLPVRKPPP